MARRLTFFRLISETLEGGGNPGERLRSFLDALSPGIGGRIEAFERRVRAELSRHEAGEAVNDPQAEALVDMLHGYLKGLEERPGRRNRIRRLALRVARNVLVDVEFALLPQRAQAYQLLGVSREESVQEIKLKFRELARRHHPDRPGGDHRKMQELNRAYEIVMRMKGAV